SNYEKAFRRWEESTTGIDGSTPPVFIVVCNNTNVSKLVYDYIAGWEKPLSRGTRELTEETTIVVPGHLASFSNELNGGGSARPNTILVDSQQLESGEGMSDDFKK